MKNKTASDYLAFLTLIATSLTTVPSLAHFQMIIPSDDMVQQGERRELDLDVRFSHPFENTGMPMAPPVRFGVFSNGAQQDLSSLLKRAQSKDHTNQSLETFTARYAIKKPGDHIFFVEPQPYWEPSEEAFIVHYTKVVVHTFGLEQGWDTELGLKSEIVPLTRPYGLWAGNVFQGIVKVNGKPAPGSEVEIEYYNAQEKVKAPADPMITQVIRADSNGVFSYAIPWDGWWGFAALHQDAQTMQKDGKAYPVEIGAVIWVRAYPKP